MNGQQGNQPGGQGQPIPIPRNYLLYSQEDIDAISEIVGKIHCEMNEGIQVARRIGDIVNFRQEQFIKAVREGKVQMPTNEPEPPADETLEDAKPKAPGARKSRMKPVATESKKKAGKKKKGK